MAKHSIDNIEWREVAWQRPFNEDNVYEMLTHLATIEGRGPIIWESRSHKGYVKNIIGADRKYMNKIAEAIKIHGDIAIYPLPAHTRVPMRVARKVSITKPSLALGWAPDGNTEHLPVTHINKNKKNATLEEKMQTPIMIGDLLNILGYYVNKVGNSEKPTVKRFYKRVIKRLGKRCNLIDSEIDNIINSAIKAKKMINAVNHK